MPHTFSFHYNETPNVGPSPEDEVDLPTLVSPETVTIDGTEYAVLISGFKQGGQIVTKFISAENGANSADILAPAGKPNVVITGFTRTRYTPSTAASTTASRSRSGTTRETPPAPSSRNFRTATRSDLSPAL